VREVLFFLIEKAVQLDSKPHVPVIGIMEAKCILSSAVDKMCITMRISGGKL
jgi:hypothetical protein